METRTHTQAMRHNGENGMDWLHGYTIRGTEINATQETLEAMRKDY